MRAEGDTVRLPSPESSLDTSRKDLLSGESVVVGSSETSGAAELAVEPAEAPWTNPESVSELSGADDPSSAGAGALGGGTESVRPLAAPEPQRRFGYRLLLADACAVETGAAAGTAPELAQVSIASVRSGASAAVPGAAVVAVASVPVEVASEGAEAQPGSFAAVPGATAVAVASVPIAVASEGAELHPAASGSLPGATVVLASAPAEVGSEGAGLHPAAGSLPGATVVVLASAPAEVGSDDVTTESVSGASPAVGEVSGAGATALVGVPEPSDGAGSSARAVLTKNDAQARAASSAPTRPRTLSHRWSARTATRFSTTALPSRWRQSFFQPPIIAVDKWRATRVADHGKTQNEALEQTQAQVEPYGFPARIEAPGLLPESVCWQVTMSLQPSAPGGRLRDPRRVTIPNTGTVDQLAGPQSEAHAETPRVIRLAPDPPARTKNTVADFA